VHGCANRLLAMHRAIAADLSERPAPNAQLVHLGDYIDRGPDSARVIELLIQGPAIPGLRVVNLMGNHEQMMLSALDGDPDAPDHWRVNGGAATLKSWGIRLDADADSWRLEIPAAHVHFVRNLALRHQAGDYLFVHAGIRPGVALNEQTAHDLMWIREPFLSFKGDFGAVVVHGHTPEPEPVIRPNRIGLDTGAVIGGALTCAVLEEDHIGLITC
jgi:serine/threonine protein phosphatase 1